MTVYKLGIVGESNYQPAVARCRPGQRVRIEREPWNPHDELALVAIDARGQTIGYIARDSWLRDAIHDQGKGCHATIAAVGRGEAEGNHLGVVLNVTLTEAK